MCGVKSFSQTTSWPWFQTSFVILFLVNANVTTVIVFKWAEITTWKGGVPFLMAVCLYSLNISHHGIVNCKRGEDRYEIFTQPQAPNVKLRPEHPGVRIHWGLGSQNILQWWISDSEVVICRNLWKWRHIYLSHPQKVYQLVFAHVPCYHLVVFGWHTFFGEVFLPLSLSFSPYMRMYLCTCTSNPSGDIALILACFSPTASRVGHVRRDHAPCKTEPVQLEDVCTTKAGVGRQTCRLGGRSKISLVYGRVWRDLLPSFCSISSFPDFPSIFGPQPEPLRQWQELQDLIKWIESWIWTWQLTSAQVGSSPCFPSCWRDGTPFGHGVPSVPRTAIFCPYGPCE